MVRTEITYQGQKRCEVLHEPSGTKMETDAPKDNQGIGASFSPTDLVGVALGSCILTTMAIVAERDGIDFSKARAVVDKIMTDKPPRRIQRLEVKIFLPTSIIPEHRKKLEQISKACPVHRSLHPDLEIPVQFIYE